MVLQRNSTRRRRLVVDPSISLGESEVRVVDEASAPPRRRKKSTESTEARAYTYGADRRNQRKTTDLVPKRIVSYLSVVALLLAGLWLINFTSQNVEAWSSTLGQSGLDTFAIHGRGSLASWFSSFLLIMTGLASLQIYALRQHRCDDYKGTYRLWLWTAGLLILASVNCVTDLGTLAMNLAQTVTGSLSGERAWIPLAVKLVALGVLMGRGMFEVRESRGSFALVVFVWIAYSAAAVMQLPAVEQNLVGLGSETMIGNCVLFGTAALFLAHLTYARFIFLHANGLIVQREKKVKQEKTKPKRTTKKKRRSTKTKVVETEVSDESAAKPKKKTTRRKATKKPVVSEADEAEKKQKPVAKTKRTKKSKPQPAAKTSKQPEKKSPSEVLKELAAASREKEQSNQGSTRSGVDVQDEEEHEGIIKMSKSQRRKQRKLEKQRRRAA